MPKRFTSPLFQLPAFYENIKMMPVSRQGISFRFNSFIVFMLVFIFIAPPAFANVVSGNGICKIGEYIHVGQIKIPWSKANQHFGYVYKMPGLSFANVSAGPAIWPSTLYQSYNGFSIPGTINLLPQITFSSPDMVVFSASNSPAYQPFNRGILLVKYYHTYGALYFSQISDQTLHYQYWYDSSGQCSFNTGNTASGSEVLQPETVIREFNTYQELSQLEITGGETYIFHSGIRVNGTLKISDGALILKGKSAQFNHITIKENGSLELFPDAVIFIKGNLKNEGQFSANNGTVVFNGNTIQFATGQITCHSLEIESTYFVVTGKLTVQELSIFKGVLIPGEGSLFHNIFIDQDGILYPAYLSKIDITGDLDNDGRFIHNHGTVTLSGEEPQLILLNGDFFYNLNILVYEIMVDALNVKGNLTINPQGIISPIPYSL